MQRILITSTFAAQACLKGEMLATGRKIRISKLWRIISEKKKKIYSK